MGIGSEDVSKVSDTWKDVQAQAAAMAVGAAMKMENLSRTAWVKL
jgi:hypothetical protein